MGPLPRPGLWKGAANVMRGTVAKRLRRFIYGDHALRERHYYRTSSGQIIADDLRQAYQQAKRRGRG